jgi:hypothetical protein
MGIGGRGDRGESRARSRLAEIGALVGLARGSGAPAIGRWPRHASGREAIATQRAPSKLRWLGPPEPQPPRAPGPLALAETTYVDGILTGAGFAAIRIETATTDMPGAATVEAEAEFACQVGPLTRLLQAREPDPATRRAIALEIAERFRPYQTVEGVRIPATLHYVTATRP